MIPGIFEMELTEKQQPLEIETPNGVYLISEHTDGRLNVMRKDGKDITPETFVVGGE